MPQEQSPLQGTALRRVVSVHNPLLPLFRRKRKVLRVHRLHLHRDPNHTTPRRTEHIPKSLILNIIQKVSLIINFKLQFGLPLKCLLLAFPLALGLFARLKVFFPPKAVGRPLDSSLRLANQLKVRWLHPDGIQTELLLYDGIIVDL